jgi:hypothetical protein
MSRNTTVVATYMPFAPMMQSCGSQFAGCQVELHGLYKGDAEDVLDWLEVHHCPHALMVEPHRQFTVSYLRPENSPGIAFTPSPV